MSRKRRKHWLAVGSCPRVNFAIGAVPTQNIGWAAMTNSVTTAMGYTMILRGQLHLREPIPLWCPPMPISLGMGSGHSRVVSAAGRGRNMISGGPNGA
jgi:hypothetical protein